MIQTSKFYAGIGSRETPTDILDLMQEVAAALEEQGWTLRSGGADGADAAFAAGTDVRELFLPWPNYNDLTPEDGAVLIRPLPAAVEMASTVHPAWDRCSHGARQLHGRNCHIILGHDLQSPVKFVLAWTPGGLPKGGTALGIMLARQREIPVFNLGKPADLERVQGMLDGTNPARRSQ